MTTLAQTKIKVDRELLIEALEGVLSKGDSSYLTALRRYDEAKEQAEKEIATKMKDTVVNGNLQLDRYGDKLAYVTIKSDTKVPAKPQDVACNLRRTIEVLKLSKEVSVPLTAEQYERFFPCVVDLGDA